MIGKWEVPIVVDSVYETASGATIVTAKVIIPSCMRISGPELNALMDTIRRQLLDMQIPGIQRPI